MKYYSVVIKGIQQSEDGAVSKQSAIQLLIKANSIKEAIEKVDLERPDIPFTAKELIAVETGVIVID